MVHFSPETFDTLSSSNNETLVHYSTIIDASYHADRNAYSVSGIDLLVEIYPANYEKFCDGNQYERTSTPVKTALDSPSFNGPDALHGCAYYRLQPFVFKYIGPYLYRGQGSSNAVASGGRNPAFLATTCILPMLPYMHKSLVALYDQTFGDTFGHKLDALSSAIGSMWSRFFDPDGNMRIFPRDEFLEVFQGCSRTRYANEPRLPEISPTPITVTNEVFVYRYQSLFKESVADVYLRFRFLHAILLTRYHRHRGLALREEMFNHDIRPMISYVSKKTGGRCYEIYSSISNLPKVWNPTNIMEFIEGYSYQICANMRLPSNPAGQLLHDSTSRRRVFIKRSQMVEMSAMRVSTLFTAMKFVGMANTYKEAFERAQQRHKSEMARILPTAKTAMDRERHKPYNILGFNKERDIWRMHAALVYLMRVNPNNDQTDIVSFLDETLNHEFYCISVSGHDNCTDPSSLLSSSCNAFLGDFYTDYFPMLTRPSWKRSYFFIRVPPAKRVAYPIRTRTVYDNGQPFHVRPSSSSSAAAAASPRSLVEFLLERDVVFNSQMHAMTTSVVGLGPGSAALSRDVFPAILPKMYRPLDAEARNAFFGSLDVRFQEYLNKHYYCVTNEFDLGVPVPSVPVPMTPGRPIQRTGLRITHGHNSMMEMISEQATAAQPMISRVTSEAERIRQLNSRIDARRKEQEQAALRLKERRERKEREEKEAKEARAREARAIKAAEAARRTEQAKLRRAAATGTKRKREEE